MKDECNTVQQTSQDSQTRMRPPLLNLRSKMALSFGVLCAVILISVSGLRTFGLPFTSDQGSHGEAQALALRQLSLLADLNKERLRLWLAERESDAAALAQNKIVVSSAKELIEIVQRDSDQGITRVRLRAHLMEQKSGKALMEELQAVSKTHKAYWKIQVADARQGVVLASTDYRELGTSVSRRRFLDGALDRAGKASIMVAKSPVSGKPYVAISTAILGEPSPARSDSTKVLGVVIMYAWVDRLIRPLHYAGESIGKTEDIVLVDQDQKILSTLKYPLPDGRHAVPLEHRINTEPARLAARGKEGLLVSRDYRGVPVLAAYRYIEISPGYGWGLVVKVDRNEMFAPTWKRLLQSSLISLLGVLAAVLLAALIAGRIARPIRDLSLVAQEVEKGNLEARAPVVRLDEVGNLALTFNSMIERIGNWHRELEEQVKSRTLRLTELNEELAEKAAERKRLIKDLESKNAELERFTYTVSHDLKSPLITIKGFLGYMERDTASGNLERVRADSARIQGAVEKMGLLLDELLELSRIGRIMNPPQEVSLTKLVRDAAETLAGRISERGVTLEIAEELPVLYGDAARLREVVENLLDNAIKFMGNQSHPRVEIGVRCAENGTVVYVKDNGTGIDARYHEKVFGLFERLEQSTEGTGVGLAIVRRIVEVHGGRIWVESEGSGLGSTFCFAIPERNEDAAGRGSES